MRCAQIAQAAQVLAATCVSALIACAPAGAPGPGGGSAGSAPAVAPAARATSATGAEAPGLQALIDGARREGQLTLVWGEGTVGGSEGIRRLADGLNRTYGLNLDVRFTPGPTMNTVAATVAQEYEAGRRATTDVYVGYDRQVASLARVDALLPVDWTSWAPNVRDPALVAPAGVAVTYQTAIPGIAYHTGRVRADEVPTSLQDLLKPHYKGRIAVSAGAPSFDRLATPELWGPERTREYARQFADQVAGMIRCNEVEERLLSGEFDLFALACSQSDTFHAIAKGAPLGYVIAADAPLMLYIYMAVPRRAAHPHAAQLWVNYLLSREAQDFLYEVNAADSHLIPGSRTTQDVARLQATGVRFTVSNVEFIQSHDEEELSRFLNEAQEILSKRRQ